MPRLPLDPILRLMMVVSLMLTTLPPPATLASPASTPAQQEETATATATATPTPTLTPTASPTPTDTPLPDEQPTTTTTLTATLTPTATATLTPTATAALIPTATLTPTAMATLTPTLTPTDTPTLTPTATGTLTPTATIEPAPFRPALQIAVTPAYVQPGEWVTVTLTLTNAAPVAVDELVISATLPPALDYQTAFGAAPARYTPSLRLLSWSLAGMVLGPEPLRVGYTARVGRDIPPTALSLTASLSGATPSSAQTGLIILPAAAPPPVQSPVEPRPTRRHNCL